MSTRPSRATRPAPAAAAGEPGRGGPALARSPRRHDGGPASARSLLLTILGEFVLPSDEPPWTATLLHVAGGLGLEEKAARQALARLAADGWITAHRAGRRVRWALTRPGHELLAEGAARIYSFGRDAPAWDGRWLVLLVTVPESRRQLRHKLRTRLTWAGFGSPLPGVWVSPHPAREAEAKQVTEQLGLSAETFSFTGPFAGIGAHTGSFSPPSGTCGPRRVTRRCPPRSGWCTSGGASRWPTRACRASCSRPTGSAPARRPSSPASTARGSRPPGPAGRS